MPSSESPQKGEADEDYFPIGIDIAHPDEQYSGIGSKFESLDGPIQRISGDSGGEPYLHRSHG